MMVWSFAVKAFHVPLSRLKTVSRTALSVYRILDVPEGMKVKTFAQVGRNNQNPDMPPIGKFRLVSSIPAETMQKNMNDYVQQMINSAKGRTIYNGYRNGVIPPYAMKEVADALVPYGVEQIMVDLLNANHLEVSIHSYTSPTVFNGYLIFNSIDTVALWREQRAR